MNQKWKLLIPLVFASVFSWSARVSAHGVRVEARDTQAVEVNAEYDTGEPMAEAQVTVYSPDDPSTPWLQSTTDKNGNFVFTPDYSKSGNWSIQVRQAGHGDIINIPIQGNQAQAGGEGATEAAGNGSPAQAVSTRSTDASFTPLQTILMGAAGIWGFIGTALFFMRGKNNSELQSPES
ncbi:carboxypeptidase-like regulatory domain-containing protein [Chroococcidiopsis sp. CCMEE 29]|uniref:carboxypeptidase-like regulatory domain-containing protein n=1 Tax=Chroococcidiopsis sp. CCMEE 29 TaxID=155894 RepID=UPI0020220218|nr:carboxypeptidase-like regulatory domain-containing protein [Chroococcidiopsis sp. CCMEE 29]